MEIGIIKIYITYNYINTLLHLRKSDKLQGTLLKLRRQFAAKFITADVLNKTFVIKTFND